MEQKTNPSQEWMNEWDDEETISVTFDEEPYKKQKKTKKGRAKKIAKGIALVLLLVVVFMFGRLYQYMDALGAFGGSSVGLDNRRVMGKLAVLEKCVDQLFIYDASPEAMEDGIYTGFMDSLGDPYTTYFNEDDYRQLKDSDAGEYKGIGVSVSKDAATGYTKVMEVFKNDPAYNAGVKVNDYIVKVNEKDTIDMTLTEVVREIKTSDDPVLLDILRGTEELQISVEKSTVTLESVTYEMKENKIGYISLMQFLENTDDQFIKAVNDLEAQGMKGLIIDLRDDGGGMLDTCINIISRIIPKDQLIVYTKDKWDNQQDYNSNSEETLKIPMVLLVNGNTASASEIMTGCLKDYGLATVIGTKTYGKGIVQSIIPLSDGSAVKVTVSSYYTPSGVNIHKKGIEPDETIEITEEEWSQALKDPSTDKQLKRAMEILTESKSN